MQPATKRLANRRKQRGSRKWKDRAYHRAGTTEDWLYFKSRWGDYIKATKLGGIDRVIQLLECCDEQLRKDLTRTWTPEAPSPKWPRTRYLKPKNPSHKGGKYYGSKGEPTQHETRPRRASMCLQGQVKGACKCLQLQVHTTMPELWS